MRSLLRKLIIWALGSDQTPNVSLDVTLESPVMVGPRNGEEWFRKDVTLCDVGIDFEHMRPFSIERKGGYITIIGWSPTDDRSVANEWSIQCSIETHNKLVDQFNKYVERKNHHE